MKEFLVRITPHDPSAEKQIDMGEFHEWGRFESARAALDSMLADPQEKRHLLQIAYSEAGSRPELAGQVWVSVACDLKVPARNTNFCVTVFHLHFNQRSE